VDIPVAVVTLWAVAGVYAGGILAADIRTWLRRRARTRRDTPHPEPVAQPFRLYAWADKEHLDERKEQR